MAVAGILLAWSAVVAGVIIAVTRPWKNAAARAPLPLILCACMAAWVLGSGIVAYGDMMADGAWTGASITLAFVPIKAVALSLLAYAAGRTFLAARAKPGPRVRRWALPAALAILSIYLVASDSRAMLANARERHAASPALSSAEVSVLMNRIRDGAAARGEAWAFLGNPACPPELLAEYAASKDPYWRRAVARNTKVDAELAAALASDSDEEVRYYLAFNRTLPPAVLSRLAADGSEMVREMVAWTKDLPEDAFGRLVDDPSPTVRATVALQPRLSPEQRAKLHQDPEQRVRAAASR